jgi:hypothetical protein
VTSGFGTVDSKTAAVEYIRTHLSAADSQVILALPVSVLAEVEDALAAAGDDALRCLLLYGDEHALESTLTRDIGALASVVRLWDVEPGFTIFIADHEAGLMVQNGLFDGTDERAGVSFSGPETYHMAYVWFIAHPWEMGTEFYTADPPTLPKTYEDIRQATFWATLLLHDDREVQVTMQARPTDEPGRFETVQGQLVTTRQQFLYPKLSSVFGEASIHIRTDEGRVSVGGLDAYFEDYEAESITLEPLE